MEHLVIYKGGCYMVFPELTVGGIYKVKRADKWYYSLSGLPGRFPIQCFKDAL